MDTGVKVPINEKLMLTFEEARDLTGIGINRIREMAKDPDCDFVLHVGKRSLIKRKRFEEFLNKTINV